MLLRWGNLHESTSLARPLRIRKKDCKGAVKHYAPYLGLSDWDCLIDLHSLDDDTKFLGSANSHPSTERLVLSLNIKELGTPKVFDGGERAWWDNFLRVVIHELLHAKHSYVNQTYEGKLQEYMGEGEFKAFIDGIYNLTDPFIDRLAKTLLTHLPKYRRVE